MCYINGPTTYGALQHVSLNIFGNVRCMRTYDIAEWRIQRQYLIIINTSNYNFKCDAQHLGNVV